MNKFLFIITLGTMMVSFSGKKKTVKNVPKVQPEFGINQALPYFEKKEFIFGKDTLRYLFHLPKGYSKKGEIWPVLIYLHGAGERGNDNETQLFHFGKYFKSVYKEEKYPAICIIPQCPKSARWVEVDWKLDSSEFPKQASKPMQLLENLFFSEIATNYQIDASRIYLTGISMGGFGTWDMIVRYPGIFAAAAPVCGGGDEKTVPRIQKTKIFCFHGAKDKLVKPSRTRNMFKTSIQAGKYIVYKEFATMGHNCWDSAYCCSSVIPWMFSNKIKN